MLNIDKVVLVYVDTGKGYKDEDLTELNNLVESARGNVVMTVEQKRNLVDPNTIVGSGKLEEIKKYIQTYNNNNDEPIDIVIFSEQLNATQRKLIEENLDCAVIDRIDLILDIFAIRAKSSEGKKQVELAQLSYNLASKPDKNYSRQGGGIGTRGPGETQIETNKRTIRERIQRLKKELKIIEGRRDITRKNRINNNVFSVALVGYTNAGKSTLFNRLTNDNVYADNLLFATLDTTVRKITYDGQDGLICDTVGFINNLPHQLIDAFKSTLEEAVNADLILEVLDISDKNIENQKNITENLLYELEITAPILRVYNKCDLITDKNVFFDTNKQSIFISAKSGENIDTLKEEIFKNASNKIAKICLKVPIYDVGQILSQLERLNASVAPKYTDDFVYISVKIERKYVDKFLKYLYIE